MSLIIFGYYHEFYGKRKLIIWMARIFWRIASGWLRLAGFFVLVAV